MFTPCASRRKSTTPETYTLTVTALDNLGASTIRTIAVKVNRPPTANGQSVTTNEDTSKAITLTGNDPDSDPIKLHDHQQTIARQLERQRADLTYTPIANYNGSDSFTFKVNDGVADSAAATVSITINPVNDAPVLTVPRLADSKDGRDSQLRRHSNCCGRRCADLHSVKPAEWRDVHAFVWRRTVQLDTDDDPGRKLCRDFQSERQRHADAERHPKP